MELHLAANEREELLAKHRKESDGKIRDRIKAVLAYDEGYSYSTIACILRLDDETIRRHVKDYVSQKKLTLESGGSDSRLNRQTIEALSAHLQDNVYRSVKAICLYVKKTFHVTYSISGMTQWLHAHGFCYKKPHAIPAKADPTRQAAFIDDYESLKQKAGNQAPIYFVDSVHPQHQTRLAYGWIKRGERKLMPMTGRQSRVNVMGGICLKDHKVVYETADKINENSIQSFLFKLRKKHPGHYKVHVIWDNAGYHTSHQVREFAEQLGIELHYLPPYSPNLNPIERLWKIMHEQVTYNRYYAKFSDFTEAIKYFFRHIGKKKNLLRARITDNFQLFDTGQFAF